MITMRIDIVRTTVYNVNTDGTQGARQNTGRRKMTDKINEAIKNANAEGTNVGNAVYIGKDDSGYWVTDNGEEVNGLSADDAARIARENLNQ